MGFKINLIELYVELLTFVTKILEFEHSNGWLALKLDFEKIKYRYLHILEEEDEKFQDKDIVWLNKTKGLINKLENFFDQGKIDLNSLKTNLSELENTNLTEELKRAKQLLARNRWNLIKSNLVVNQNSKTIESNNIAFQVGDLSAKFRAIDKMALNYAHQLCQQYYSNLKIYHEKQLVWIGMLEEAFTLAEKNVTDILSEIDDKYQRREQMLQNLTVGMINIALSACGAQVFAKGIVQVVTEVEHVLSDNGMTIDQIYGLIFNIVDSDPHTTNIKDTLVKKLKRKLDIPIGDYVNSQKEMFKKGPKEFLEIMKEFVRYKLNGVALEAREMFNPVGNNNYPLSDGVNPVFIIKSLRMKKVKLINLQNDRYYRFLSSRNWGPYLAKLSDEINKDIKDVIDNIFFSIYKQYENNDEVNIVYKIINYAIFNDTQAGVLSVDSEKKEALISELARVIEAVLLCQFAVVHKPFFGGKQNPSDEDFSKILSKEHDLMSERKFALNPTGTSRFLMKKILELIEFHKNKKHPLLKKRYFQHCMYTLTKKQTDSHKKRGEILKEIINDYALGDITPLLTEAMLIFGLENKIIEDNGTPIDITNNRWLSESELRKNCRENLKEFTYQAEHYLAHQKEEMDTIKTIFDLQKAIKH